MFIQLFVNINNYFKCYHVVHPKNPLLDHLPEEIVIFIVLQVFLVEGEVSLGRLDQKENLKMK